VAGPKLSLLPKWATASRNWLKPHDDSKIYHFGASLKDLGEKWFAFSKMDFGAVEMLGKLEKYGSRSS
jgi:hypothetical protein